ncbi:MAG: DUF6639 family protein [Sedimenticolaceae bacterium]
MNNSDQRPFLVLLQVEQRRCAVDARLCVGEVSVRLTIRLCLAAGMGFAGIGAAAPYQGAQAVDCPAIEVEVTAESPADRALVCEGAIRAQAFFRMHGIVMKHPIRIRLHPSAIENYAFHIGVYDASQRRIDLLTPAAAKRRCRQQSPFGLPMDAPLYTSFVVHEVAHAIADQNFKVRPASQVAHEYIAYAAQLAMLPAALRSEILHRYTVAAFDSIGDMSSTYQALDPSAFGVKVFRHYQSLPDQGVFIRNLLSGTL